MITEITTKLYTFEDLPTDKAKEKARDWWRTFGNDSCEYDYAIEDAKEVAALFGYDIKELWWSGFCHQGQGAVAEGYYAYKKGGLKAVKTHAPFDTDLHDIVQRIQDAQKNYFYQLCATTKQWGSYMCLDTTIYRDVPQWGGGREEHLEIDELKEAIEDFSKWVFKKLSSLNDELTSDEYIDDCLTANEYTFLECGSYYAY